MRFKKRSRRFLLVTAVLAAVLVLGGGSAAVAVDSYIHQVGGEASYDYEGWYTSDWVPVSLEDWGVFDLHNSVLAAYAENLDLGSVGTRDKPGATGVVTAISKTSPGCYLKIDSVDIYSNGTPGFRGAQGVYAQNSLTSVNLFNCNIWCDQFSGHGLYVHVNATIAADRCTITTNAGTGAAAVASGFDNGGAITLKSCKVETWGGPDSPAFYSSGGFYVADTQAFSHASDGAWLDGGGTLKWTDEKFYNLVMYNSALYVDKGSGVSFAKGPTTDVTNDNPSGLWMTACYLQSAGPVFYAPNSKVLITLDHTTAQSHAGVLLTTKYDGQGVGSGQPNGTNAVAGRESSVTMTCDATTLRGDVITDVDEVSGKDSVVDLSFSGWSSFEGAANKANQGEVDLTFAHESNWEVTDTSHVYKLNLPTVSTHYNWGDGLHFYTFSPDLSMIHSHGHLVYYDPLQNPALQLGTYQLPQGGWLVPERQTIRAGMRPGVQY